MRISLEKLACSGLEEKGLLYRWFLQMKKTNLLLPVLGFRRRVFLCCMLVMLVALYAGSVLIIETQIKDAHQQFARAPDVQTIQSDLSHFETAKARVFHEHLRTCLMTVLGVIFLCILILIYLGLRNIMGPLYALSEAVQKVAEGQLQVTAPTHGSEVIIRIGQAINELTTNLQEILLHVWNHTEQDIVLLDRIASELHSEAGKRVSHEIIRNIELVHEDIKTMQMMVNAFNYHNVRFEGEKVVAEKEPRP